MVSGCAPSGTVDGRGEAQLEGASRHFAAVGSARSILAALEAESRPIHAICASEEKHGADFARIERLPSAVIEKRAQGNTHGGLLARVGARRYSALASLLPPCGVPFLALLDGVEDPYNFGQALRSL